ncbi:hypothetical protein RO575_02690 [Methylomonas sp. MO1]|uniref:hypothetical protein n=1 Tax=Methylomonas sp. MO1 TaxID=3073619 RepID=UPI0028A48A20|nr:hypothetical protein [Methylomonas sp. MO1]MDT4288457.1 hypothetical protein [Methylomonas sp. MO1]
MNAITLDRNALNGLFENQKKLDDLFDSIFDDDNFFISSAPASVPSAIRYPEHSPSYDRSKVIESLYTIKHHPMFFVLPITLELSVFYWVVTHLL